LLIVGKTQELPLLWNRPKQEDSDFPTLSKLAKEKNQIDLGILDLFYLLDGKCFPQVIQKKILQIVLGFLFGL